MKSLQSSLLAHLFVWDAGLPQVLCNAFPRRSERGLRNNEEEGARLGPSTLGPPTWRERWSTSAHKGIYLMPRQCRKCVGSPLGGWFLLSPAFAEQSKVVKDGVRNQLDHNLQL